MDRLGALSVGIAVAITLAILSGLCFFALALWPGTAIDFFNTLLHLDLTALRPAAPLSLSSALYGMGGWALVGFVAGLVFAWVYNIFNQG
jgi:hypothetical protein